MTEVEKKGTELLEVLAILLLKKEQDWEVKLLTVKFCSKNNRLAVNIGRGCHFMNINLKFNK